MRQLPEEQVRSFFVKWSPRVFRFCRLLYGDDVKAEQALERAFLAYLKRDLEMDGHTIPILLFTFAMDAARMNPFPNRAAPGRVNQLEDAIHRLPVTDRAIFILGDVMHLDAEVAGKIVEMSIQEVSRCRVRAYLGLRELMSEEFFKKQVK